MFAAFIALAAVVAFTYVGYPVAVLLFAWATRDRAAPRPAPADASLRVALVIPAHDEQAIIEAKLRNFLALDYAKDRLRAVVLSDGSTDATCERVRALLADLPPAEAARIALVDRTVRAGKSAMLSEEVPKLDVDVVVFTDANAFYRPGAIRALTAPFADPRVGLVCGRLRYVPDDGFMSDEELYWRYEDMIKEAESRAGRLLVANGSIYALRAELFRPIPGGVADDFVLPLLVASEGHRVVYESDAIAEERLPAQGIENFRAKARIVTRGATALSIYWREVLRSGPVRITQYAIHKVARWLMGLVLAGLLLVSAAGAGRPLLAAALSAQVAFYLLGIAAYLLARRGPVPGLLRMPFYFLLVNAAALAGLFDFARGRRRVTWEKSETTRRSPDEENAVIAATPGDVGRFPRKTAAAVAVVLVLAAGLAIETGARLTYTMRDGLRAFRGAVPPKGLLAIYERPDPRHPGNWLLKPNLALTVRELSAPVPGGQPTLPARARALGLGADAVVFTVNERGYKGPPLVEDPARLRALVVGDSCAFGSVIERASFPRVLERRFAELGRAVDVVNGGVASYHPAHVLARIDEFRALAPDVTVLCIGWDALYGQRYAPTTVLDHLYTLRALSTLGEKLRAAVGARASDEAGPSTGARPDPSDPEIARFGRFEPPFLEEVAQIGTALREGGSRVFVLTLPSLYLSGEHPTREALEIGRLPRRVTDNPYVIAALISRYNQRLREQADGAGLDLVDAASWARVTFQPRDGYFASATSLNEAGQERLGAFVAERIDATLAVPGPRMPASAEPH